MTILTSATDKTTTLGQELKLAYQNTFTLINSNKIRANNDNWGQSRMALSRLDNLPPKVDMQFQMHITKPSQGLKQTHNPNQASSKTTTTTTVNTSPINWNYTTLHQPFSKPQLY